MLYDIATNNRIDKIHERAERGLRIAYRDTESSFDELLVKDNPLPAHHSNFAVAWLYDRIKTGLQTNAAFVDIYHRDIFKLIYIYIMLEFCKMGYFLYI